MKHQLNEEQSPHCEVILHISLPVLNFSLSVKRTFTAEHMVPGNTVTMTTKANERLTNTNEKQNKTRASIILCVRYRQLNYTQPFNDRKLNEMNSKGFRDVQASSEGRKTAPA